MVGKTWTEHIFRHIKKNVAVCSFLDAYLHLLCACFHCHPIPITCDHLMIMLCAAKIEKLVHFIILKCASLNICHFGSESVKSGHIILVRIWAPFHTKVPIENLYPYHVECVPTSLDCTVMSWFPEYSTLQTIQSILDELEFPYKSMGEKYKSMVHLNLKGDGDFYFNGRFISIPSFYHKSKNSRLL